MIISATINEVNVLAKMAIQMWKNNTIESLESEFKELINSNNTIFFIKYLDNKPIGFAQCSLRNDYVEGTNSSPVGYLEGVYIIEGYRNKGYAKQLVLECENWAKEKGCIEFASDCELDNINSLKFHLSIGFDEVNRVICFKKRI